MTLVDTSVWVDHFRKANPVLIELLTKSNVVIHAFTIGELACGNLKNRSEILHLLSELPQAMIAEQSEVLSFIESNRLYGTGIGWIDAHLVASALLMNLNVLTYDKALTGAVSKLRLG